MGRCHSRVAGPGGANLPNAASIPCPRRTHGRSSCLTDTPCQYKPCLPTAGPFTRCSFPFMSHTPPIPVSVYRPVQRSSSETTDRPPDALCYVATTPQSPRPRYSPLQRAICAMQAGPPCANCLPSTNPGATTCGRSREGRSILPSQAQLSDAAPPPCCTTLCGSPGGRTRPRIPFVASLVALCVNLLWAVDKRKALNGYLYP